MDTNYGNEGIQELLAPLEQQTLQFYGQPIVVVRLPDNRPAVVLRFLCENLQIDTNGQVRRIRRTEAIIDDLVTVRVDRKPEEGGPQAMAALVLRSVPFWLAGIDAKKVSEEVRPDIIRYQKEVVDVLYSWAQTPRTLPSPRTDLIPAESPAKPTPPQLDAPQDDWIVYYQQMIQWHQWRQEMQVWKAQTDTKLEQVEERQDEMEVRMESMEAITDLIPEILERLGPETLTSQHQHQVQVLAKQLHQATNKPYPTIYDGLRTAFQKPRYQDILEDEWPQVEQWFKVQIERARKPSRQ